MCVFFLPKLLFPESTSILPLHAHCSKTESKEIKQSVAWPEKTVLEFPKTLVFGPEQQKAIMQSKRRVTVLMGEPGSGKTTVLLALLFKYTGKHVPEIQKKKVVFSIPPHKTTFREDVYSFIKKFCSREWVEVVMVLSEREIGRDSGSTIYLFDEVYDTNFLTSQLNVGKVYVVLIAGENMTYASDIFRFPRPDYEIIYFRKLYRSPAGISKLCVKLKRLMDKERLTSGKSSQSQKFSLERIPWEMSLSNRHHVTETSAIEVKSYRSFELSELYGSIDKTEIIVTLNLRESKIKELDDVFKANRIFHQNTKQRLESEFVVQRTDAFDMEVIVLACGRNFTIAALKCQSWLLECMKLKQCDLFIICHGSIIKQIESFLCENVATEVQLFLPCYADFYLHSICSEMSNKLHKRNVNARNVSIVTFDLELEVAKSVGLEFCDYVVHHMNLRLSGKEKGNHLKKELQPEDVANLKKIQEIIIFLDFFYEVDVVFPLSQYLPFVNLDTCSIHIMSRSISLLNYIPTAKVVNFWEVASYFVATTYTKDSLKHLKNFKSKVNRLIFLFGITRAVEESILSVFPDARFVRFQKSRPAVSSDENYQVNNVPSRFDREKFTHVIFLDDARPGNSFPIPQLRTLLPPVEPHCRFILIGSSESYRRFVGSRFKIDERPFLQTLCYSNSTDIGQLISMVPCCPERQLVLLSWNIDQSTLNIPEEYKIMDVSRFPIDENHCSRDVSGDVTHLILVCGKLSGSARSEIDVVKALERFNVKEWIFILCHYEDRQHIESVLLSSNIYYAFSYRNSIENPRVGDYITRISPLIYRSLEGEVLILTWKAPEGIRHFVNSNLRGTIRHLDDIFHPVEYYFSDVILIFCGPLSKKIIDSLYWNHIEPRCNFYLVSDEDIFDEVLAVLPKQRFHFSRIFCFFGYIHEQLIRIQNFKMAELNVFLLTSFLDRNIAAGLMDKFPQYTIRHLDPMPWSSDSLSFTGSEFDRVVLLCDESVDPEARETISVLYTTLSRSKQDALIICHESIAEKMRDLLSLSCVDQVFEQLRSSVNLGANILASIDKEQQILEVFEKVIVTRNESQFNSLKRFITECKDPKFDCLFDSVRSMLLTCFSCGHETARMLNNFLLWKPSKELTHQVFYWNDYFFLNYVTVEERKKILECIDPQFRSISFDYENMELPKLKLMAFTAVVWSQLDMLSDILDQLFKKYGLDDEFFDDLLFKVISMYDSDSLCLMFDKCYHFQSDVFSSLEYTLPFISPEFFSMLLNPIVPIAETSALSLLSILPC